MTSQIVKKGVMLPNGEFITAEQIRGWTPAHRDEFLETLYLGLGNTWDIPTKSIFPSDIKPKNLVDSIMPTFLDINYSHLLVKHILNFNMFPYQMVILKTLWTKLLPMVIACRGGAKSTMLALYVMQRALVDQGVKIIIAGGGLRQAGLLFTIMESIWNNSSVLRDICGGHDKGPKRTNFGYEWRVGQSIVNAIPMGSVGDKIRGMRANVIVADEFSAINPEIFETVIRGFGSVASKGTFEIVKQAYQEALLEDLGIEFANETTQTQSFLGLTGNQIIISGTATYQFNHFFKYFERYCDIIINKKEDYDKFAVIRIPFQELPKGLMDKTILAQGQAIMDSTIFKCEYGACFARDSDGFYPASIVYGSQCPLKFGDNTINFDLEIEGDPNAEYAMGLDPASERDNLTISIIKINKEESYFSHVYTWKVNRKLFEADKEKYPKFYVGIYDYNTFIIKKIHELHKKFNIVRMHMDSGGGGVSIIEGLKDPTKIISGGSCIYDIDDPNMAGIKGAQIIKLCHFSNREWYESAHYNLLKDFTAKRYIFPNYDQIAIAKEVEQLSTQYGSSSFIDSVIIDSLENISSNIEEAKYQTTLIQETTSTKGMKKWDLPKIKGVLTDDIRNKLKKDHFTSILLACDAARDYLNVDEEDVNPMGGMAIRDFKPRPDRNRTGQKYHFLGENNAELRNKQKAQGDYFSFASRLVKRGRNK